MLGKQHRSSTENRGLGTTRGQPGSEVPQQLCCFEKHLSVSRQCITTRGHSKKSGRSQLLRAALQRGKAPEEECEELQLAAVGRESQEQKPESLRSSWDSEN